MNQSDIIQSVNDNLPKLQEYQRQFVDYLRDPLKNEPLPASLPPKIDIYARLLQSKIKGSLQTCFPITRKLLGQERWQNLAEAFIREHRCQSPLFREIPDELIDYLMNEDSCVELPEFIIDLAHYEWLELILETAMPTYSDKVLSFKHDDLTSIPALNPVLYLLKYRFPVQTIHPVNKKWRYWKNWKNRFKPYPQKPVILAGIRDKQYKIHFIELNPVTARLIELLQDKFRTGEQALLQLAAELHYASPKTILPFGIQILQQLEEQEIIIGARNAQ